MRINAALKPVLICLFSAVVVVILWRCFIYSEPPIVIHGDEDVLSKLHVNVYLARYDSDDAKSTWNTIFLNGKSYSVDDQDVDSFVFYINYDNKLFYYDSNENRAIMLDDISFAWNNLLLCKIDSRVYVSFYSDRVPHIPKCSDLQDFQLHPLKGMAVKELRPLEDVVKKVLSIAKERSDIKTKHDEDLFISDFKKSFFEVVVPANDK